VPLDAEHRPAVRSLERFRRPVVCSSYDPKPWRHPIDGLMVVTRGRNARTQRPADPAIRIKRDGARAENSTPLRVWQNSFNLRQMLDQVAAERDVEHLQPAADAEHRHTFLNSGADKRELGVIAVGSERASGWMRFRGVRSRIDVRTTANQ
jgi:hypothetical protein